MSEKNIEPREPITHELKCDHGPFQDILSGSKTSEVRRDDRDFRVGDRLNLLETVNCGAAMAAGAPLEYTGGQEFKTITHIQRGYGLPNGLVVLSFAAPQPAPATGDEAVRWIVVKEHVWDHGDGQRPTLAYLWPSEFDQQVFPTFEAASKFICDGEWPLAFVAMQIKIGAAAPPSQPLDMVSTGDEREAFEAWVTRSGRGHLLARDETHDWYIDLTVTALWSGWQASAAHRREDQRDSERIAMEGWIKRAVSALNAQGLQFLAEKLESSWKTFNSTATTQTDTEDQREALIDHLAHTSKAPLGFTEHEASAWSIGVEYGISAAYLRQDRRHAEMYRWLESQCVKGIGIAHVGGPEVRQTWFVRFPVIESGQGMSLSDAIDAAMQRTAAPAQTDTKP